VFDRKEAGGVANEPSRRSGAQSRVASASARRAALRSWRAAALRLTGIPRRGTRWSSFGGPSPASSAFRHPSAAACNALTSSGWSFSHEIIPNSTRRFTFQTRQTEANEERKSSLIFNLSIHHTDYYFYYH
jgi:hypothetical protein